MGGPGRPAAPPQDHPGSHPGYAYQFRGPRGPDRGRARRAGRGPHGRRACRCADDGGRKRARGSASSQFSPCAGSGRRGRDDCGSARPRSSARGHGPARQFCAALRCPATTPRLAPDQSLATPTGSTCLPRPRAVRAARRRVRPPLRWRPARDLARGRIGVHRPHPQRLPAPPVLPGARPVHVGSGQPRGDAAHSGRSPGPLDPRGRTGSGEPAASSLTLPGLPARRGDGRARARAGPGCARGRALLGGAPPAAPGRR